MEVISTIEKSLWLIMTVCYAYQLFYICYMLFRKKKADPAKKEERLNTFGIVISARNEENVIGQLINSIHKQNYPEELLKIYVVADNCTDRTAEICREKGAAVFERFNKRLVGKGYALDFLFKRILKTEADCDAFVFLDADNILDKNYILEMNRTYNKGYRVITSYRNSKNYGSNWISAGYSLWFLRESKYLNNARMELKTSCAISGTGFLVKREIIEQNNGWKHHLLTEDIEFSVDSILQGEKIGYAENAMLFDEQPVTFQQSWNQRLRWAKGFYQVLGKYGKSLLKSLFTSFHFSCFDMIMTIFPAVFVTLLSLGLSLLKIFFAVFIVASPELILESVFSFIPYLGFCYALLYIVGLIATVTEWKNINCPPYKTILYTFTFPIFMFTYIPIAIAALFKKVEWTPIEHTITITEIDLQDNEA